MNPAQPKIAEYAGDSVASDSYTRRHINAYDSLEVVNRGVNILVDASAEINFDVKGSLGSMGKVPGIRKSKIDKLLNFAPNPYISTDVFRRNIVMDLLIEGNAFIWWDGAFLYNLPATSVVINTDPKTFVKSYTYAYDMELSVDSVIHIRENSATSIYRGSSRLDACRDSIALLKQMTQYHKNFFDNGTVPGLVLTTPNVLSQKIKQRIVNEWSSNYSPKTGGRRPMVLDGEFDIKNLGTTNLQELDFANSIRMHEERILSALGVPPILLNAGNNANISPNIKMMYQTTILPIVEKIVYAYEWFFGYDLDYDVSKVSSMRPELKELSNYYTQLTNAGILTRNEARVALRQDAIDDPAADKLTIPANVAGSQTNPGLGGAPGKEENPNANAE